MSKLHRREPSSPPAPTKQSDPNRNERTAPKNLQKSLVPQSQVTRTPPCYVSPSISPFPAPKRRKVGSIDPVQCQGIVRQNRSVKAIIIPIAGVACIQRIINLPPTEADTRFLCPFASTRSRHPSLTIAGAALDDVERSPPPPTSPFLALAPSLSISLSFHLSIPLAPRLSISPLLSAAHYRVAGSARASACTCSGNATTMANVGLSRACPAVLPAREVLIEVNARRRRRRRRPSSIGGRSAYSAAWLLRSLAALLAERDDDDSGSCCALKLDGDQGHRGRTYIGTIGLERALRARERVCNAKRSDENREGGREIGDRADGIRLKELATG